MAPGRHQCLEHERLSAVEARGPRLLPGLRVAGGRGVGPAGENRGGHQPPPASCSRLELGLSGSEG